MDSTTGKTATRPMSPPLQELGQALKLFREGSLSPEALEGAILQFEEKLHLLELPEMAGTDQGQPGVSEAMMHHAVLLREYRLGFGDLMAGLSPPSADKLDIGFQRMAAADALLGMLFDAVRGRHSEYQRKSEEASTVSCPRCGTRNRRGSGSCQQCRFVLPQTLNDREETDVTGGGGGDGDPTASVAVLRGLATLWTGHDNSKPLSDKLTELNKNYHLGVQKTQNLIGAEQIGEEVRDVLRQTVDTLQGLVESTEQALALVEQGNHGSLEGLFGSMEAQLHDVESLRHQFAALAEHYKGQLPE